MTPGELSRYLRTGDDPELRRRRWLVGLSLLGAGMGQLVAAYQTGLLQHLPDPPVGPFDSDRVDASDYAYKRARTPDGLMMVATYATTALLAGAGGRDRARTSPPLALATAAKALADVVVNLKLAGEEWRENKAFCAYCQTANLVSVVSLALAMPDAARAYEALRARS